MADRNVVNLHDITCKAELIQAELAEVSFKVHHSLTSAWLIVNVDWFYTYIREITMARSNFAIIANSSFVDYKNFLSDKKSIKCDKVHIWFVLGTDTYYCPLWGVMVNGSTMQL